ncbi:hypothetical protein F4814DRAFT_430364 [Daldinia grandis]|nr:hypothetical protein F4814DRAFT_430364 [Daldinia grandis]
MRNKLYRNKATLVYSFSLYRFGCFLYRCHMAKRSQRSSRWTITSLKRSRGATVARSTPDRKVIRSNRVGISRFCYWEYTRRSEKCMLSN